MYLRENSVLQRELLLNLRRKRAFLLLLGYLAVLGAVVYVAWPQEKQIDLMTSAASQPLVNLFFAAQFLLVSLLAPSFAAGAITGEKERQTYEMLLASPLRPAAILLGKWLASLVPLVVLIFASLPIVMLCLPLGGTSFYEVLAAYAALILAIVAFGLVSLACSSYFQRSVAAHVVSYLLILPAALALAAFWQTTSGMFRLVTFATVLPLATLAICVPLFRRTAQRLLHPPDLGAEGREVVDEDRERREAVFLVIHRGQFPDNLFAPAKRDDLLEDGANPVLDKEMRSEVFSQGTLMMRVVIQISMALAIPLMFYSFYYDDPGRAPWYVNYVVLFNLLVGPVFSAGAMTSERERQTLELLLTTALSPWQILWAKLISGWRVSAVLTSFLLWPLLLACVLVPDYWNNLPAMAWYVVIVLLASVVTTTVALAMSVVCRTSMISLAMSYLVLLVLFAVPPAVQYFSEEFLPDSPWTARMPAASITSPFSAALSVPLEIEQSPFRRNATTMTFDTAEYRAWPVYRFFTAFYVVTIPLLVAGMTWFFRRCWRVV
ncbi:MAG: ABC transporter permease subunit [Pirellulales bacterium]|nr:ABC transporter permease subunit [Pirellulales bacterium]